VRQSKQLQEAVAKTLEKFGHIDFVICGEFKIKLGDNDMTTKPDIQVLQETSLLLSRVCQRMHLGRCLRLTRYAIVEVSSFHPDELLRYA
jgi:hypothetical protein